MPSEMHKTDEEMFGSNMDSDVEAEKMVDQSVSIQKEHMELLECCWQLDMGLQKPAVVSSWYLI